MQNLEGLCILSYYIWRFLILKRILRCFVFQGVFNLSRKISEVWNARLTWNFDNSSEILFYTKWTKENIFFVIIYYSGGKNCFFRFLPPENIFFEIFCALFVRFIISHHMIYNSLWVVYYFSQTLTQWKNCWFLKLPPDRKQKAREFFFFRNGNIYYL